MTKSIVSIKKENKLDYYMEHLNKNIDRFKSVEGVIGITLNGGLSRGYGDHLSEVDITIYLVENAFCDFTKGLLKLKEGICKVDKEVYDVKVVEYKKEYERIWSPFVELWDLSYAKILYDPKGHIEKLLETKLEKEMDISNIQRVMFDAWWHYKLAGDIWIYREDAIQGHMMLNESAKAILKSLFIANKEYVPHDKWLVHMIGNLHWLPMGKDELLKALFSTNDLTLDSLIIRQKDIDKIWNAINDYIKEKYFKGLPVDITKKYFYDTLLKLVKFQKISIDEFTKITGLRSLHSDPYAEFLSVDDGYIYIDQKRLLSLDINSMYTWHFDITRAIQNTINKSSNRK